MPENISFQQISSRPRFSRISLAGKIENVINAQISEENTACLSNSRTGYSFGLGAFGSNFTAVRKRMGEFLSTPDFSGVLTSGEENVALSEKGMGNRFYAPFNVALGFDFAEVYSFAGENPFTISEFYGALFHLARNNPAYKGLLAVSAMFTIGDFYGSLIKISPLKGSLPQGKISDQENFDYWFRVDKTPVYQGYRAVSLGLGLDVSFNKFPPESTGRIFYFHPANVGKTEMLLHNHCFLLPPGSLPEKIGEYNSALEGLLENNTIIDVKHILDNSTLQNGFVAFNIIEEITEAV